jgi:curli biogenesis system outer membrane secretion channel CsgG
MTSNISVVRATAIVFGTASLLLSGVTAGQTFGGGDKPASGAAGGGAADNAAATLERCDESFGTMGVEEDRAAPWYHQLQRYNLGSTVPVLRMMIQQSNCFVVVERSAGGMATMSTERQLQQSGELREGSNFGRGQMVAADYTMRPSVQFSGRTGGGGGFLGGLGALGAAVGAVAGALKQNEAATTLLLIDNRSSVQISASEGSAKNFDFSIGGALFGGGAGGGAGAFTSTPEGKIITAAFADSYNQMVRALRNYRAQTVRGGLGTGGRLGVQGGTTDASRGIGDPAKK